MTRLSVEAEDGAAAVKTHERWRKERIKYLKKISKDCSQFAREIYDRELARLATKGD